MSAANSAAPSYETVAVGDLRPDPEHARQMSPGQLDVLERLVRRNGLPQPLVVTPDLVVVDGIQRLTVARRIGLGAVPVAIVPLPIEDARLLAVALNQLRGSWDEPLLAQLLARFAAQGDDLSLTGFSEEEVANFLRDLGARAKREQEEHFAFPAALRPMRPEPTTRRGDLWLLGPHRLLCGDATSADDVERLLESPPASMAFTDPPYNVDLGSHGAAARGASRHEPIRNDNLPPAEWEAFLRGTARSLLGAVDGAVYVCMSSKEWPLLGRVLEEEGGHWSDTLVWAKDAFVLGRADHQRQYEPIWYGWRKGAKTAVVRGAQH